MYGDHVWLRRRTAERPSVCSRMLDKVGIQISSEIQQNSPVRTAGENFTMVTLLCRLNHDHGRLAFPDYLIEWSQFYVHYAMHRGIGSYSVHIQAARATPAT